jgi:acyl-CoA hydrolase
MTPQFPTTNDAISEAPRWRTAAKERTDRDEPRGELTTKMPAMPADASPNGDIFGGWVLSQMDIAGDIAAGMRAQGRVA